MLLDQDHIIRESSAGLAVPYDENEFKKAIISIISNKSLYSKMSNNGKNWIFSNRTYDDLSIGLIQKYRGLTGSVV